MTIMHYVIVADQNNGSGSDGQDLNTFDSLYLKPGVLLQGTNDGIMGAAGNNDITIEGSVLAGQNGIGITGEASIVVGQTGSIVSEEAGIAVGGGSTVINNGDIQALSDIGITVTGGNNFVSNSGSITGTTGIATTSSTGTDIIANSGTIQTTGFGIYQTVEGVSFTITNSGTIASVGGPLAAVGLDVGTGDSAVLVNSGTISSTGGVAIAQIGPGDLTLTNHGTIYGDIEFSGGNDTYKGPDGAVDGRIDCGSGNDTVKGGVGDETVDAGMGKDTIKSGDGDDTLNGGGGADQMDGGNGSDRFEYFDLSESTSKTFDTIAHFDGGDDSFVLSVAVHAIDSAVKAGMLRGGSRFDSDLAAAVGNSELKAHDAVLFTASKGTYAAHTFLIVDANGHAGYQASADYVIELSHAANLGDLAKGDFSVERV